MEENQILFSLKTVGSSVPSEFSLNDGDITTNPYDIANILNNYFPPIAKCIKYSHKHFSDYLSSKSGSTIFLQLTDQDEIAKASGPNRINYRILFFLKNEILKHLADFFNLFLMTGVFPSVLKTVKVVPVL